MLTVSKHITENEVKTDTKNHTLQEKSLAKNTLLFRRHGLKKTNYQGIGTDVSDPTNIRSLFSCPLFSSSLSLSLTLTPNDHNKGKRSNTIFETKSRKLSTKIRHFCLHYTTHETIKNITDKLKTYEN